MSTNCSGTSSAVNFPSDSKVTKRPFAEIIASALPASRSAPDEVRLTRIVVSSSRSRTKASRDRFPSPATMSSAPESNATYLPSQEMVGGSPLAVAPSEMSPPNVSTLIRSNSPVARVQTNTSLCPLPSSGTRSDASETNATNSPFAETEGASLEASGSVPSGSTLTHAVFPDDSLWMNTSLSLPTSVPPNLPTDPKTTHSPSGEIHGSRLYPFTSPPLNLTLTLAVVPAVMSRTKTSLSALPSLATRLVASDSNATREPSAERELPVLIPPRAWASAESMLTRLVLPVEVSCTNTSVSPFVSPVTRLEAFDWNAT